LLPPFPDRAGGFAPDAADLVLKERQRLNCSRDGGKCAAAGEEAAGGVPGAQQQLEEAGQRQRVAPLAQQQEADGGGVCFWSEAPPGQPDPPGQQQPDGSQVGSGDAAEGEERWQRWLQEHVARKCAPLCADDRAAAASRAEAASVLHAALPLLPLPPGAPALLRARRCAACRVVTAAVRRAERAKARSAQRVQRSKEAAAVAKLRLGSQPASAANGLPVNRQFLCVVEVSWFSAAAGRQVFVGRAAVGFWAPRKKKGGGDAGAQLPPGGACLHTNACAKPPNTPGYPRRT
jgi:hypothetical protein